MVNQLSQERLREYVAKGLITEVKHPDADLYIYNYTPKVQFGRQWDEYTLAARGLIMDGQGNVIARPFTKFFNYQEHFNPGMDEIPAEEFTINEKLDGSLGILYWDGDKPYLATRGSFSSDQAVRGTAMLHEIVEKHGTQWLEKGFTYLFEIIYPENRIVVDYGTKEELVLLAVRHTETGAELNLAIMRNDPKYPVRVAQQYPMQPLEELAKVHRDNSEGYVIQFKLSGMRVKIKHAEYVRLHRILTQVSTKTIWQYLAVEAVRKDWQDDAKMIGLRMHMDVNEVQSMIDAGNTMDVLLEKVPDEFYNWVKATVAELEGAFAIAENEVQLAWFGLQSDPDDRKARALEITKTEKPEYKPALFAMLDNKPWQHIIWHLVKPAYSKPFVQDIDA